MQTERGKELNVITRVQDTRLHSHPCVLTDDHDIDTTTAAADRPEQRPP
jgi:hypothetical protein